MAHKLCRYGHVHPNAGSAHGCEMAWRYVMRKRMKTNELVAELRAVLARGKLIRQFDPTEQDPT